MNIHKKRFWITSFTLIGSIIGAGFLGLPYVFSKSGFLIGLFWLVLLGGILCYSKLALGEVTLRTKEQHQLTGYAKKYLGEKGKAIAFFSMFFGIYSALLAYLIGEGQSLSLLFTGSLNNAFLFGFGFWLIMTLLLQEGLRGLKKVESWGVIAVIVTILVIFILFLPNVNLSNLNYIKTENLLIPFGVTLFALLGFVAIPELRREIKGSEKMLKKSILFGSIAPIIIYAIFSFAFVGVLGENVNEVATLSFDNIIIILGVFTMLTSYFVLSFALKDMFFYDFHKDRRLRFIFVSAIPLLLYAFITFFDLASFIMVLGIGGVIAGGVDGILALLMNMKAKRLGDRKPEYSIPINWLIGFLIMAVFIFGIIVELFL